MPRKKISVDSDFKKVKSLHGKGKLEDSFADVDPANVLKSLQKIPVGPLRMMIALRATADAEGKIAQLNPDQREPAKALLEIAKKDHVLKFLNAVVNSAVDQEDVRKALGIDALSLPKQYVPTEVKLDATITKTTQTPQLMLNSLRLYVEMGFMQGDELLFRSDMELDDILWMAHGFLAGVEETLKLAKKKIPGVTPNLEFDRCQAHMKNIRSVAGKLSVLLKEFAPKKTSKRSSRAKKAKGASKKQSKRKVPKRKS